MSNDICTSYIIIFWYNYRLKLDKIFNEIEITGATNKDSTCD